MNREELDRQTEEAVADLLFTGRHVHQTDDLVMLIERGPEATDPLKVTLTVKQQPEDGT